MPKRHSPPITREGKSPIRVENAEPPLLLFRVAVQSDTALPIDIGFLSTFADERECVYPPGVYFEQRKEAVESLSRDEDAEEVAAKVVEVGPSNAGRTATIKKSVSASASAAANK